MICHPSDVIWAQQLPKAARWLIQETEVRQKSSITVEKVTSYRLLVATRSTVDALLSPVGAWSSRLPYWLVGEKLFQVWILPPPLLTPWWVPLKISLDCDCKVCTENTR